MPQRNRSPFPAIVRYAVVFGVLLGFTFSPSALAQPQDDANDSESPVEQVDEVVAPAVDVTEGTVTEGTVLRSQP